MYGEEQPQISRATYEQLITKDEAWRKVAGKFPDLSMQILGALRFALKKARSVEDRYTTTQIEIIAHPFTHDIIFSEVGIRQFLEDIFIRRIMEGMNPNLSYIGSTAAAVLGSSLEGNHMREELGLKEGICKMTLEEAVRAAITGRVSLTRQTPAPVKVS